MSDPGYGATKAPTVPGILVSLPLAGYTGFTQLTVVSPYFHWLFHNPVDWLFIRAGAEDAAVVNSNLLPTEPSTRASVLTAAPLALDGSAVSFCCPSWAWIRQQWYRGAGGGGGSRSDMCSH
jgi:hypothetical protein